MRICGQGQTAPTATGEWPDLKLDEPCCEQSFYDGPGACTCWEPIWNLEQQPPDETAVKLLAAGIEPTVRPTMCHDCAYRPDSPEKRGEEGYAGSAEMLEEIVRKGHRFWCHDGNVIAVKWRHPTGVEIAGSPSAYKPPAVNGVPYKADGSPSFVCAGWDARRRALASAPTEAARGAP